VLPHPLHRSIGRTDVRHAGHGVKPPPGKAALRQIERPASRSHRDDHRPRPCLQPILRAPRTARTETPNSLASSRSVPRRSCWTSFFRSILSMIRRKSVSLSSSSRIGEDSCDLIPRYPRPGCSGWTRCHSVMIRASCQSAVWSGSDLDDWTSRCRTWHTTRASGIPYARPRKEEFSCRPSA